MMTQVIGLCLLAIIIPTLAAPAATKKRSVDSLSNPSLTIAVLRDLIDNIVERHNLKSASKRGHFDGGYGSRFASASNYGNKLMALQAANSYDSPGRKRRDATDEQ